MNKNEILESFKTIHWSIDPLDSLQYYFVIKYIEKKINKHPGKGSSTEIYNIYNYVIDKEKKYLRGLIRILRLMRVMERYLIGFMSLWLDILWPNLLKSSNRTVLEISFSTQRT